MEAPCLELTIAPSLASCLTEWSAFEAGAHGTLYQSSLWCRAWMETAGLRLGVQPRIVMARHTGGALQFILPFQIRRRQGVRVLEWLGSPHHNYGTGLFSPAFLATAESWFATHWPSVISPIGGFDAVALTEMPRAINGWSNPAAQCANLRGPNLSFSLSLDPDFEALHAAKRSSDRRRAARKHESGLRNLGTVSFGLPLDKAELHSLIDVMFRDQQARLAELGIHGVFGPAERDFIHRLAELQDEASPILAPYHLKLDGKVLSVMLGGIHANGYWALISSLSQGPSRKYSPGDIALRQTIEACCTRGLSFFDFSSGDAAYKRAWADDTIELTSCIRGVNLRGLLWAGVMALHISGKRMVKSNPVLLRLTQGLRRMLLGKRSS